MKLERIVIQAGDTQRDFYVRTASTDTAVVGQIFIDRAFDISQTKRFPDLLAILKAGRDAQRRPLIIDAGANIGAASVYFSVQCRDALVVAIEPEPANFQLLTANTAGLPVLPLPCAISDRPEKVQVVDAGSGPWGFQTRPVSNTQSGPDIVGSVTIDEIYAAHAEQCFPFIVKIDIEGAEKELFRSNTDWISSTPLLIIELHDWMLPGQGSALPFLRTIAPLDRDFFHIGENIFSVSNTMRIPVVSYG